MHLIKKMKILYACVCYLKIVKVNNKCKVFYLKLSMLDENTVGTN